MLQHAITTTFILTWAGLVTFGFALATGLYNPELARRKAAEEAFQKTNREWREKRAQKARELQEQETNPQQKVNETTETSKVTGASERVFLKLKTD